MIGRDRMLQHCLVIGLPIGLAMWTGLLWLLVECSA